MRFFTVAIFLIFAASGATAQTTGVAIGTGVQIGGSGGVAGGNDTQVQYNSGGALKGEAPFTYDDTVDPAVLTVESIDITCVDGECGVLLKENTGVPTCSVLVGQLKLLTNTSDGDAYICRPDGNLHAMAEYETNGDFRTVADDWYVQANGNIHGNTFRILKDDSLGNPQTMVIIQNIAATDDDTAGSEDMSIRMKSMVDGTLEDHLVLNSDGPAELRARNNDGGLKVYNDGNSAFTLLKTGSASGSTATLPESGTLATVLKAVLISSTDTSSTPASLAAAQVSNGRIYCTHASGCRVILPAAVAGMGFCIYDQNGGGDIEIDPEASDVIELVGSPGAAGIAIDSSGTGARGDYMCLEAPDASGWVSMDSNGTWAVVP